MTTAIDTNVLVALWDKDPAIGNAALGALNAAMTAGHMVVAAPVFAELMAAPGREESFLNSFFGDTGIVIEWELEEAVWRAAGRAFRAYAARRKRQAAGSPRRIVADFLIGAHAFQRGYRLLTLDAGLYRAAFPGLVLAGV